HWNYGEEFLRANRQRYHGLFVMGRCTMIPISCAGLWILWKWASELLGSTAGLASAAIWTFEPDVLAHGSIVGTDMGTAVAVLLACWAWWRSCQQPTRWRMLHAALAVAIALLCKFTALIVFPMLIATGLYLVARKQ